MIAFAVKIPSEVKIQLVVKVPTAVKIPSAVKILYTNILLAVKIPSVE